MIFLLLHLRPKGRGRKENPCVERKSRRDRTPSWKQKGWGSGRKGRQKRESLLNAASIQRSVSEKFGLRNRAQKQFAQKGDLQRGTPSVKLDGSSRTETRRRRGLQKREKVSRDQVARGADLGRRRRPRQNLRRRSGREEGRRAAAPRCPLLVSALQPPI